MQMQQVQKKIEKNSDAPFVYSKVIFLSVSVSKSLGRFFSFSVPFF